MKMLLSGLAAVLLGGAAQAAVAPVQGRVDAFLSTITVLTATQASDVEQRCTAALALGSEVRSDLEARTGAASVDADFRAYDALYNLLSATENDMDVISSTNPAKPVRDAARACTSRVDDATTQVSLSRAIYDRLSAIPLTGLDAKTRFALTRELRAFRLAGVDRDAATRARVQTLQQQITDASLAFDGNIAERRGEITLKSAEDLQGLPQDYIDAHKPGPDGLIHISTDYTDVFPLLTFAQKAEVRKAMYVAFHNRAWPANEAVLKTLLQRRFELAQLLGFKSYADVITADKMIGSAGRAAAFLDQINAAAEPAALRDGAVLLARERQVDPSASTVPDWDYHYVKNLVEKEKYEVDGAIVRQYFTYDKARAGIFQLVHDLFGAEIRPWRTPVWNPDVSAWELYDKGALVGRLYLDMHPRDGKYTHAETAFVRPGLTGRQIPVGMLICNFPAAGPMDHGDVTTFLHEFGHLIHFLYSGRQEFALQSVGKLEMDFIEAPSQLLEEWTWDYDTLSRFATDPQGHAIPATLVARMNAARHFGEAIDWKDQIAYSAISLDYHDRPPGFDLTDLWRTDYDRYSARHYVDGTHPYASLGHLTGYSALVYTYVWSEAIALDLFTRFKAAGIRDPQTAAAYRRLVLEPGGNVEASELIHSFLGRDMSAAAFKQELSAR